MKTPWATIPFDLRVKLVLLMMVTLCAAMTAATLVIIELVYVNIVDQKKTMAVMYTNSVVNDIKYEYNYQEQVPIDSIVSKHLAYYKTIKNIHFYSARKDLFIRPDEKMASYFADLYLEPNSEIALAINKAKPDISITETENYNIDIRSVAPVLQGSKIIGAVVLDISIQDISEVLSSIIKNILLWVAVIAVLAVGVLYVILRNWFYRFKRLLEATTEISSGNYAVRLADTRDDEVGTLSVALEKMAFDLQASKKEIDSHQHLLEQKVADATAELKQTYRNLQEAQGQLVLSEKMASLGVLIAGIAHEINTPVGAISNLFRQIENTVERFPQIITGIGCDAEVDYEVLESMLSDLIENAANVSNIASMTDIRRVEKFLRQQQIENWREKAAVLASFNFKSPGEIEKYLDCLRSDPVYKLFAAIGNIAQAVTITKASTVKIQDIIKALKFYVYTDKDRVEYVQINESIKNSLILLHAKTKHNISIKTKFSSDLPTVPCTSEINQIWTVLIANALDAIQEAGGDDQGEIRITTDLAGGSVRIRLSDNGGGIPEKIIDKIFDPFFTTKDIGKGTGLGLSIVSGIIKKHNSTIKVNTGKGITEFEINIPVQGVEVSKLN